MGVLKDCGSCTEDLSEELYFTSQSKTYRIAKRIFDFTLSLLACVVLLVPMCILSAIIMAKDFGSPFFLQTRVGFHGKRFKIVKFRSMKCGADNLEDMLTAQQRAEYRKEYKLQDDPRLIGWMKQGDGHHCFGALLRRTSLDELPQILVNICFLGNMSIVGPRPVLPEELRKNYTPEEQHILLSVKPGLTGYWQAYARNNATYESGTRQKMELFYAKHANFWLDFKILFATVSAVIHKQGAI